MIAIAIVAALAVGFGAGRVHHISGLKAKLLKLEEVLSAEEKAVLAKIKEAVGLAKKL